METFNRLYLTSFFGVDTPTERPDLFTIELPQNVSNVKNLEVNSATIEFLPLYPNFSPDYSTCEIQEVSEDTVVKTRAITIDSTRQYNSPSDVVNALNSGLGDFGGSFSYDQLRARLTYTGANATRKYRFPPVGAKGGLTQRLGMPSWFGQAPFFAEQYEGVGAFTFPCSPKILQTSCLYLATSLTNDALCSVKGINNIISMMQLTQSVYGQVINFELKNSGDRSQAVADNLSSITIQVLNDKYEPIEFSQNATVSVEIMLEYETDGKPPTAKLYY